MHQVSVPPPDSVVCPKAKCRERCPCVDWDEIDLGFGYIQNNYRYECKEHGPFMFDENGEAFFLAEVS